MSKISKEKLDHFHALIEEFHKVSEPKYIKGAIEHGTKLWETSDEQLEEFETEEIIDLAIYRMTRLLKRRLNG
jgi:hypothetical protein